MAARPSPFLEEARRLLCALGDHIRERLIAVRGKAAGDLTEIAAVTSADTIYRIDRVSEAAILDWFARHWPSERPVEIVMEGIEEGTPVTFPPGLPARRTAFKCILDPIDGTRGLMHDKRSAWALAGLAPQRGARTGLGDIVVAAMTELPTSKQGRADQASAVRGRGLVAEGVDLVPGRRRRRLSLRPSRARDCLHGFASLARFFPEGKALTARIEEELWRDLYGGRGTPVVFDDQYLSTGGQLYELMSGRDRMVGDIRPLVLPAVGRPSALVCHPYDICTAMLLREAGGVVESPGGGPVEAPLDTTTPVAWVGYANRALANALGPALRRALRRCLGSPPPGRRGIW